MSKQEVSSRLPGSARSVGGEKEPPLTAGEDHPLAAYPRWDSLRSPKRADRMAVEKEYATQVSRACTRGNRGIQGKRQLIRTCWSVRPSPICKHRALELCGEARYPRKATSFTSAREPPTTQVCQPTRTYLSSRYSLIPSCDPSRPIPDSLTPPNGAEGSEATPTLTATMPDSILPTTSRTWSMS